MEKDKLMTAQELAKHFEVSRQAIYKWMKDGMEYQKVKEIGSLPKMKSTIEAVERYHKNKERV